MDFIERLRNKPVSVRRRFAFITSVLITLAIFGLWATVWHFNISQKTADTNATASVADSDISSNPFSVFVQVFSKGWEGLTNNLGQINAGWQNIKNLLQTSGTSTPTSVAHENTKEDSFIMSASSTSTDKN